MSLSVTVKAWAWGAEFVDPILFEPQSLKGLGRISIEPYSKSVSTANTKPSPEKGSNKII